MLHQLYAVGVGQHQIKQDQVGPFRLDEVRQVMVVAGYQGQVVGFLPAPLGPIKPTISPLSQERDTFLKA